MNDKEREEGVRNRVEGSEERASCNALLIKRKSGMTHVLIEDPASQLIITYYFTSHKTYSNLHYGCVT